MRLFWLAVVACVPAVLGGQSGTRPPRELPALGTAGLARSLEAARLFDEHIWRDTAPVAGDQVAAYVEIPRGDRRKWEFDMRANARAIDRIIPGDLGGYPINYGFVPQTISWDGDPFDALVLGPPLPGGALVHGVVVAVFYMSDEKGYDAKVVLSPRAEDGSLLPVTDAVRQTVATYFREYKRGQPGAFSTVAGWGGPSEGRDHVTLTHSFFRRCQNQAGRICRPR